MSLTFISCKIMETIKNDNILDYLLSANLITFHQHCFLRYHSTSSQFLKCMYGWAIFLNLRVLFMLCILILKKTFDSVSHSKLIFKLKANGFTLKLVTWLKSFLNCRTQTVRINSTHSDCINVLSGVPQRCVLGPTLLYCLLMTLMIFVSAVMLRFMLMT